MRLRDIDGDGHGGVYVLYSDLLFNLLIMFTIFVLALVLRFNDSLRQIQSQRAALEQSVPKEVAPARDLVAELSLAQRERDASRAQVAAATRERDQAVAKANDRSRPEAAEQAASRAVDARLAAVSKQLSIAAGANRFTGRSGGTTLCVAVDASGARPVYVPVNASDFESAHATLDGETDEQHKVRSAQILLRATRRAERFTENELAGLFAGLVTRRAGDEGTLTFNFSVRATLAASGVLNADGSVDVRGMPDMLRQVIIDSDLSLWHQRQIGLLLDARDRLRPNGTPTSVPTLTFALISPTDRSRLSVGGKPFTLAQFRQIVSAFGGGGVILQYAPLGDELCPDWITRDVLTPIGYTNAVPDSEELQRLRQRAAAADVTPPVGNLPAPMAIP